MSKMNHKIDMLEQRGKHLTNVINRFGNYDKVELDFGNDDEDETTEEKKEAVSDLVQEIQQEYQFNKNESAVTKE